MRNVVLLILVFLSFFGGKAPEKRAYRLSGYAQGTTYHLTYFATDSVITQSEIDKLLAGIDSSLSIYKPYSLISKFNDSPRGIRMDKYLEDVVRKSLEIYKTTDGIFDFTVYPLVRAWGFGTKKISALPDSAAIRAIMPCVGSDKISIKGDSLIKAIPCLKIDVNGIAQGYSVDLLACYLEKRKISSYIVEIGGELRVKGPKPDGQMMQIGIETPAENAFAEPVIKTLIQIKKGAITTSGNYRKFTQSGDKKISHLINPKTGFYLQNNMISVTVFASDAITADGYDNALMGMSPSKAISFVDGRKDLEAYIIYLKEDGSVSDTASQGFKKMMIKNSVK